MSINPLSSSTQIPVSLETTAIDALMYVVDHASAIPKRIVVSELSELLYDMKQEDQLPELFSYLDKDINDFKDNEGARIIFENVGKLFFPFMNEEQKRRNPLPIFTRYSIENPTAPERATFDVNKAALWCLKNNRVHLFKKLPVPNSFVNWCIEQGELSALKQYYINHVDFPSLFESMHHAPSEVLGVIQEALRVKPISSVDAFYCIARIPDGLTDFENRVYQEITKTEPKEIFLLLQHVPSALNRLANYCIDNNHSDLAKILVEKICRERPDWDFGDAREQVKELRVNYYIETRSFEKLISIFNKNTDEKLQSKIIQFLTNEFQSLDYELLLDVEWDHPLLANLKTQAIAKLNSLPLSVDIIERLLSRKGKRITQLERDYLIQLKRDLPDLNKTLTSYAMIRRETENLNLKQYQPFHLQVRGETFPAFDISQSTYRFIVHGADALMEPNIEATIKNRMDCGFLCTSLISNEENYFYEQRKNYAMVLSVDERNIVATAREDAYTPYHSDDPETKAFYNFYQRLQLLTGYIDKMYRESGLQEGKVTDDFTRLCRLRSMYKKRPEWAIGEEIRIVKSKYGLSQVHDDAYAYRGISSFKLKILIDHYQGNAQKLEELNRCSNILHSILGDDQVYHKHIHPILGPNELLLQTPHQFKHEFNRYGDTPFNEINLDLSHQYDPQKPPVSVKAILVDYECVQSNLDDRFPNILRDARGRYPILVKNRNI